MLAGCLFGDARIAPASYSLWFGMFPLILTALKGLIEPLLSSLFRTVSRRVDIPTLSHSYIPLGSHYLYFCLCKTQEDIKHIIFIGVLRGV